MRISSSKFNKIKELDDHMNYYNKNGQIVPSVTTVLKIINKDSLIKWANSLGWKRKNVGDVLDSTSKIGTYAHNISEAILHSDNITRDMLLNDMLNDCNHEEIDQCHNAVKSFQLWYNDNKEYIELIGTEISMNSDRYGGTADLVCIYKGKLVIFDLKTSSDFYFTMFLQLAAYAYAYKKLYGKLPEDIGVIRLDKKLGTKAEMLMLSELPYGDLQYYYRVFNKALDLYYYLNVIDNDWKIYKQGR